VPFSDELWGRGWLLRARCAAEGEELHRAVELLRQTWDHARAYGWDDVAVRYQSASDLAGDIRRYLADQPVLARRPSLTYVIRKFVKRNRLIAACAAVTIVVEAAEDGGGLTTAAAARAIERPVLAVPGDLDRPASRGTLALLRTGARVCGDAGDVLAAMGPLPVQENDPDARLRAQLAASPIVTETLAAGAGLAVEEAMARLWRLELAGLAESHPGGRWSARTR